MTYCAEHHIFEGFNSASSVRDERHIREEQMLSQVRFCKSNRKLILYDDKAQGAVPWIFQTHYPPDNPTFVAGQYHLLMLTGIFNKADQFRWFECYGIPMPTRNADGTKATRQSKWDPKLRDWRREKTIVPLYLKGGNAREAEQDTHIVVDHTPYLAWTLLLGSVKTGGSVARATTADGNRRISYGFPGDLFLFVVETDS
jgi:hypothetical protein